MQIALLVGLALLVVFPQLVDKFYVQFVSKILILAIFAMSLNLLVGCTGLVSLGHAAFFGAAGYSLAMMTPASEAASFWVSLPVALGVAALTALVIGFLVVRTSGVYFIMATLAFGQMVYFFVHDSGLFGGSDGKYIYFRPDAAIGSFVPFDLENPLHMYYVVLAALLTAYALLATLLRAPFGRVIVGIKANEHRMRSLGYATFRYKLVAFVIAGTLAGLAGYLGAAQDGVVNPELLSWHQSGAVLMMVILGGMGSLAGPVLGALAMKLMELALTSKMLEVIHPSLPEHWVLAMGIFIILVVIYLPDGLQGLLTKLARRGERDERG